MLWPLLVNARESDADRYNDCINLAEIKPFRAFDDADARKDGFWNWGRIPPMARRSLELMAVNADKP